MLEEYGDSDGYGEEYYDEDRDGEEHESRVDHEPLSTEAWTRHNTRRKVHHQHSERHHGHHKRTGQEEKHQKVRYAKDRRYLMIDDRGEAQREEVSH